MKISEWLANTGTSQSELARRLGITQGRVSQLVAGAQPSLDLAMKIAALTGNRVKPADFKDHHRGCDLLGLGPFECRRYSLARV